MKKMKTWALGESGMSLVEIMIALGLLGILFLIGSRVVYLGEFWKVTADADHTVVKAKMHLLQLVDCNTTVSDSSRGGKPVPQCDFDPQTCTPAENFKIRNGAYVPLMSKQRKADGTHVTLITRWQSTPSKGPSLTSPYGKLLDIRAGCGCCDKCIHGKGLFVEYRKLNSNARYEPLFGGFRSPKVNFPGVPLSCVVP